jgi:stalled ribosome alternative rescue factor ArfA
MNYVQSIMKSIKVNIAKSEREKRLADTNGDRRYVTKIVRNKKGKGSYNRNKVKNARYW